MVRSVINGTNIYSFGKMMGREHFRSREAHATTASFESRELNEVQLFSYRPNSNVEPDQNAA